MEIPFERFPEAIEEALNAFHWAGVTAMTRTAFKSRAAAISAFKDSFTIRAKTWPASQIRYQKATMDEQFAEVYTESKEMASQESGGARKDGSDYRVPVAAYDVFGLNPNKVIPRQYRAKQIVGKTINGVTPYIETINGVSGVWAKTEDGVRLLYALSPEIEIKAHPWFYASTEASIQATLEADYDKAVEEQMLKALSKNLEKGSGLFGATE